MHGCLKQSEILHNVIVWKITLEFFKSAAVIREFSIFAACCFSCLVHVGKKCVPQVRAKHCPLENHICQHEFFGFGTINCYCCGSRGEKLASKSTNASQTPKCLSFAINFFMSTQSKELAMSLKKTLTSRRF